MYLKHFSLNERPFTISPDPRFLFMSNRYREALAHLTYGVQEGGGFVLLTGEVGTGKTTVCRCLLQQLPEKTRLAFVLNPKLNSVELLATICDELKVEYPENCTSLKILTDKLSAYLLKSYQDGYNVVVMIDEAQNLATEVLEQIRLLTNLETNQKKLLQIILVGQPELQEKLAQRDLRQLAQRITARYHLRPLNIKETVAYVLHRVRIAGSQKSPFSRDAIEYLHAKTMGIPRLVNTICDRALFAAAARQKDKVDKKIMAQAVMEVMGESKSANQKQGFQNQGYQTQSLNALGTMFWVKPLFVSIAIVSVIFAAYWLGQQNNTSQLVSQKQLEQRQATEIKPHIEENLISQLIGEQRWDYNGNWSMQSLLSLWQIDYSPIRDGNYCEFSATYGLECSEYQGNWQQLREFNRPAILKFSAGLQGEFWGTLKALKGQNALMVFGDKESQISLEKLSTLWTGKYILLWQSPQGFDGDIKIGDKGEAVSWLSQSLIDINQLTLTDEEVTPTAIFDVNLKEKLINYQTKRNINADGIVGMQTILKINAENLPGIPLLNSK
jgi:general secretion pathway protein A